MSALLTAAAVLACVYFFFAIASFAIAPLYVKNGPWWSWLLRVLLYTVTCGRIGPFGGRLLRSKSPRLRRVGYVLQTVRNIEQDGHLDRGRKAKCGRCGRTMKRVPSRHEIETGAVPNDDPTVPPYVYPDVPTWVCCCGFTRPVKGATNGKA